MAGLILHTEIKRSHSPEATLVLVHGVAGSLHIWDPVFDALTRDHDVIRLDLLGYGHSPKPRIAYTPHAHAVAIKTTLQALGVTGPFVMVGLSMGSTVVLEYARAYPDDIASLIMIGYPYYRDAKSAEAGLRHNVWARLTIERPLLASVYVPFVWALGRVHVIPPRLFAGIYSPLQARETLLSPYRVFRSNIWCSMVDIDARALLNASVGMRRLFLHGEHDEWSPADTVERAVTGPPDTAFVIAAKAGHNLVVLEPAATVAAIRRFLEN